MKKVTYIDCDNYGAVFVNDDIFYYDDEYNLDFEWVSKFMMDQKPDEVIYKNVDLNWLESLWDNGKDIHNLKLSEWKFK